MDNRNSRQNRRAERLKYIRIQRGIRIAGILLAIILAVIALLQGCSTRRAIEDLAAQIRAKKLGQAQQELLAMQPSPSPSPEIDPATQGTTLTLSFGGEIGLGTDNNLEKDGDLFNQHYEEGGPGYFFKNVKSIFEGDDLTACSLFGSITLNADPSRRLNWNLALRADPVDIEALQEGGIDAVNLGNAHAYDYNTEGYVDTLANLDESEVGRFGNDIVFYEDLTGHTPPGAPNPGPIRVGFVGVWEDSDIYYETTALECMEYLQGKNCNMIIVMVTWESKDPAVPDDKFIITAHKLIDNGADLIVGIQPDILQGIEYYHGKHIVYSLGTLMSCDPELGATDACIFQQTFTILNGQVQPDADFTLIPCLSSGDAAKNDLCPVVAAGDDQSRILDTIYSRSSILDGGISREDGGLPEAEPSPSPAPSAALQPAPESADAEPAEAPESSEAEADSEESGDPSGEETESEGVSESVSFE